MTWAFSNKQWKRPLRNVKKLSGELVKIKHCKGATLNNNFYLAQN